MSTSYWGMNGVEIDKDRVAEIAPDEFKSFMGVLDKYGMDLEDFAKYMSNDDAEYIMDIDVEDLLEAESELASAWESLSAVLLAKHNIKLGIAFPFGDIMGDESNERAYLTIDNAYLINKEIDPSFLASENHFSVVSGG